jgi:hypothetical protein
LRSKVFKTEYTVLNVPEPLKLANLEEVEKHFRALHKEMIVKPVESLVVAGVPSRNLRNHGLQQLIREEWEEQKRFSAGSRHRLEQGIRVARPAIFSRSTRPSRTSAWRARNFWTLKPRRFRKPSGALSATSMRIQNARAGN